MESLLARSHQILASDIDPQFLRVVSVLLGWEYDRLFESLQADQSIPPEVKAEEFAIHRGGCAARALVHACDQHGVPYNFRQLECNGQSKLLVKVGRVVLIQEPMLELSEKPRTSDYKVELADTHGLIRQLELDLGDQPRRILDWSGSVLAVLLHAPAGPRFTREHKALGGLMLAVPDAAYQSWVMRLDLHRIAMFGFDESWFDEDHDRHASAAQQDMVTATLRKRRSLTGTGQ